MIDYPSHKVVAAGIALFCAGVLVGFAFAPGPWTLIDTGLVLAAGTFLWSGISTLAGLYRAQTNTGGRQP